MISILLENGFSTTLVKPSLNTNLSKYERAIFSMIVLSSKSSILSLNIIFPSSFILHPQISCSNAADIKEEKNCSFSALKYNKLNCEVYIFDKYLLITEIISISSV